MLSKTFTQATFNAGSWQDILKDERADSRNNLSRKNYSQSQEGMFGRKEGGRGC